VAAREIKAAQLTAAKASACAVARLWSLLLRRAPTPTLARHGRFFDGHASIHACLMSPAGRLPLHCLSGPAWHGSFLDDRALQQYTSDPSMVDWSAGGSRLPLISPVIHLHLGNFACHLITSPVICICFFLLFFPQHCKSVLLFHFVRKDRMTAGSRLVPDGVSTPVKG
jgi:hypothetical protein